MSTQDVQPLEPISLRDLWPNEASDFTPWLARHIDRLGAILNLSLEDVKPEVHLPGAGRVDLTAKQVETGARVVIENQLGESDDSHCLRLLGYAANAEASILIWVARFFHPYHLSILTWLNEADNIDVYAVRLRAYKVGGVRAADFETVIAPAQRTEAHRPTKGTFSTVCADFYRPIVKRLREEKLYPVGRGGFRGRYRSFQSGHTDAYYYTAINDDDGVTRVNLVLHGADHQKSYEALLQRKGELPEALQETLKWGQKEKHSSIYWDREGDAPIALDGPEEELDPARQWLGDKLIQFRDAFQPLLDQILRAENGSENSEGS